MGVVLVNVDKAKIARLRSEIRALEPKVAKLDRLISIARPAFSLADSAPLPGPATTETTIPTPTTAHAITLPANVPVSKEASVILSPPKINVSTGGSAAKVSAQETPTVTAAPEPAESKPLSEPSKPAVIDNSHEDDDESESEEDLEEEEMDEGGNLTVLKPGKLKGGLVDPKVGCT